MPLQLPKSRYAILAAVISFAQLNNALAEERIKTLEDGDSPLCAIVKQQAERLLRMDNSFCAFPTAGAKDGIELVAWTPATDDQAKRAWSDFLALNVLRKNLTDNDLDQFWSRNAGGIMKTFSSGASLQSTRIDFDNDGTQEVVYRATTIMPLDQSDLAKGWATRPCHGLQMYYSVFFSRTEWARMGTLATGSSVTHASLFRYRGRTYEADVYPTMLSIAQVIRQPPEPSQAFGSQRCSFLAQ